MNTNENRDRYAPAGGGKPAAEAREDGERTVAPAVDIYEEADGLHVIADLPGVPSDGVVLDVDKDVLSIQARFGGEDTFRGEAVYSELAPVVYHRAFALGEDLDAARITATMKDGVLELLLPKAECARTRTIPIRQG